MGGDRDRRTGWLRDLKPGDKVIVSRSDTHRTEVVRLVEKVTPTGRLTVGGMQFDARGYRKISTWHSDLLSPWTPAGEDAIKRAHRRAANTNVLRNVRWHELSDEVLEQLATIVRAATTAP